MRRVPDDNERVITSGVMFLGLFIWSVVLVFGVRLWWQAAHQEQEKKLTPRTISIASAAFKNDADQGVWRAEASGKTLDATLPADTPMMPGGRLIWKQPIGKARIGTSFGYTIVKRTTDVGIYYLEHYGAASDWRLLLSQPGDGTSGGWGGVMLNPKKDVLVAVFALPQDPGRNAPANSPTRVSVFAVTGREVVDAFGGN